jgi:hypothetical protein
MVSILYCDRDFEAANIALKVQSLSQSQPVKIYIVPKHYGRSEAVVSQNLNKTDAAIFLAYESKALDEMTAHELSFLKRNKVPVKYIVPNDFQSDLVFANGNVIRYDAHPLNNNKIINDLSRTVGELNTQMKVKKVAADENSGAVFFIIGMALFLLGLVASTSADTKPKLSK